MKTYTFGIHSQKRTIDITELRIATLLSSFDRLSSEQKEEMIETYYTGYVAAFERAQSLYDSEFKIKSYKSTSDSTLSEMFYYGYITTALYLAHTNNLDKIKAVMKPGLIFFQKVSAGFYRNTFNAVLSSIRNPHYLKYFHHPKMKIMKELRKQYVNIMRPNKNNYYTVDYGYKRIVYNVIKYKVLTLKDKEDNIKLYSNKKYCLLKDRPE